MYDTREICIYMYTAITYRWFYVSSPLSPYANNLRRIAKLKITKTAVRAKWPYPWLENLVRRKCQLRPDKWDIYSLQ